MPLALSNDLHALLETWQALVRHPLFWREVGVLLLAAVGALLVRRRVGQHLQARGETGDGDSLRSVALKSLRRIVFPLSMLLGVLAARGLLLHWGNPVDLLDIAIPLLLSLVAIRVAVYVLRKTFRPGPVVQAWENIIATSLWIAVALHLLGWLPAVLAALDAMDLEVGRTRVSLLEAGKLILSLLLLWLLALWLARVIEGRITRSTYLGPGMQVALVKLARFVLLVLAFLLALDAVGIDLTALAVFGGALGVGLGFGLQRIASNFISGFIVLFDRSIRPGDVISIDNTLGWVQELHARYVVVRDRNGVERLIPNETLITTEVINWSYSDSNVRMKLPVSIGYDDDPEQAMALLLRAARFSPRVLAEPAPTARLMSFGDSGIQLELRVWIQDPEQGLAGVRSDINLAIWRLFREAGIGMPYPQRDVHIRHMPTPVPDPSRS
ncbi:MAG TPA: mechanosensitive ion channel [Thiobacillaceae bacterium]|nr:mechanosensitive ion channel [Thiobacillaceae bacterium]HNU63877.1 mechanosensitive ion channel [Thiobacillaceae bacterium]